MMFTILTLLTDHLNMDVDDVLAEYQIKIIYLQSQDILKNSSKQSHLLLFLTSSVIFKN